MCGRFALTADQDLIASHFAVDAFAAIPPRYNIAPTQPILAVRPRPIAGQKSSIAGQNKSKSRELAALEWGLVPEWSKQSSRSRPLINARAETIEEKASFRSPIKRTRCLVPFTGWYEWRREKGGKQPYLISLDTETHLAAFAAVWTVWHGQGGENWLETVALVTAAATGPLASLHHRKPLVMDPSGYESWLKPQDPLPRDFWQQQHFLPESAFTMRPVSQAVNDIRNDGAACHQPPTAPNQGNLFDF